MSAGTSEQLLSEPVAFIRCLTRGFDELAKIYGPHYQSKTSHLFQSLLPSPLLI